MRQSLPGATSPVVELQNEAYTTAFNAVMVAESGGLVIASSSKPTKPDVVSTVEGDHDGIGEGDSEGATVGFGTGCPVGWIDGRRLGFGVGIMVGGSGGELVGGKVGESVGASDGVTVGCIVGSCVGEHVTPEKQTPSQPRSESAT